MPALYFAKFYCHRAIVLETDAMVLGMVDTTINRLTRLRRIIFDRGCIRTLLHLPKTERVHRMAFIGIVRAGQDPQTKPKYQSAVDRAAEHGQGQTQ